MREIKTYPVYACMGAAILLYVTLAQADEMIRNGSALQVPRRGFALRLTGHRSKNEAGQLRDQSCYMGERIVHASACGDPRAMGMVQEWERNHAGLCPRGCHEQQ